MARCHEQDGEDGEDGEAVLAKSTRFMKGIVSMDNTFVVELKTLAKTCNFCDCLRDSLIRDCIVLGIGNEQTTKKLLRIRDLTLNKCIDICRSEEIDEVQMKTLSEPVDGSGVQQVTSKVRRQSVDGKSKKISCKFCGYEHQFDRKKCPAWGKTCNRYKGKIISLKSVKTCPSKTSRERRSQRRLAL